MKFYSKILAGSNYIFGDIIKLIFTTGVKICGREKAEKTKSGRNHVEIIQFYSRRPKFEQSHVKAVKLYWQRLKKDLKLDLAKITPKTKNFSPRARNYPKIVEFHW